MQGSDIIRTVGSKYGEKGGEDKRGSKTLKRRRICGLCMPVTLEKFCHWDIKESKLQRENIRVASFKPICGHAMVMGNGEV